MPTSSRRDPLAAFNIRVEIDGVAVAAFTECSGLTAETDVIAYREGTDHRVRYLPGLTKYDRLTLKRGLTLDRSLWDWHRAVVNGQVERRSGSIILLDDSRQEVARWTFHDGWPAKWEGPTLKAGGSDIAIETLEIVHEGLEWAD